MTYVLEDLELPRRVLAWIDSNPDRIGNQVHPRNTAVGLSAHLTDDPHSFGDTSVEGVVRILDELAAADLVAQVDGAYQRTNAGNETLGGTVYAAETKPRRRDKPAE